MVVSGLRRRYVLLVIFVLGALTSVMWKLVMNRPIGMVGLSPPVVKAYPSEKNFVTPPSTPNYFEDEGKPLKGFNIRTGGQDKD